MKKIFALLGLGILSLSWQGQAQVEGPSICLKKSLSTPCLNETEIQELDLEFARVHRWWKKSSLLGSQNRYQNIIIVKHQDNPQDYAKFEELYLVIENSVNSNPTVEACSYLKEKGIDCRTGAVEGTWLSHAQGLMGVHLHFTQGELMEPREMGMEKGKMTFEAPCQQMAEGEEDFSSKALRCHAEFVAKATLDNNGLVSSELNTFNYTCALVPAEEILAKGPVSCQDLNATIQLLRKNFGQTTWRNSFWGRVADGRTNHYLTGY